MKRKSCLRELGDILKMAEDYDFLWDRSPKLEIEFYFSIPEQDESARISLGMKDKKAGFHLYGTYFGSFIGENKNGLNAEQTWQLASRLLGNQALKEGRLITDFVRAFVPSLGDYLAKEELSKIPKGYLAKVI